MGGLFSQPADPIAITYNTPGCQPKTEEFDFLVVACDPRGLQLDTTEFEDEIRNRLMSHTFHTTLFCAARPNRAEKVPEGLPPNGPPQVNYAVRFNPVALEKMDGAVYGFRDEVSYSTLCWYNLFTSVNNRSKQETLTSSLAQRKPPGL